MKDKRKSDRIGFRNQVVHEYPDLEDADVWEIVQRHLPLLLSEVRALLPPGP